jgi:cytoplasmic iron level regulating protein YaaA (DUF328/UPF0246 family)
MIICISPAKTFNLQPYSINQKPYLNKGAHMMIDQLKLLDKKTIVKKMSVSDKLADQIMYDYNHFGEKKNAAIFSYYGHQYRHFNVATLDPSYYPNLKKHLFILSAVYGILNALDDISVYRLEMQDKTIMNLYDYWSPKIPAYIRKFHKNETIINLCSKEYGRIIENLDHTINIEIYQKKQNKLSIHSMEAKRMRGLFARCLIENPSTDLKTLSIDGYCFNHEKSDEHHYIYIKEIV